MSWIALAQIGHLESAFWLRNVLSSGLALCSCIYRLLNLPQDPTTHSATQPYTNVHPLPSTQCYCFVSSKAY